MDRLDAMGVFVAIADAGSLSAAARALDAPLTTVSRKLADLESRLKTRLITRSTRSLALTDSGREYLAACRQILEQVQDAEGAATGAYAQVKGTLTLAAPIVFGRLHAVPVIADFLERHPAVDVRLLLGDRNVNLLEEHVDAALRIGTLPDSALVATQLGTIVTVACASPAYLARHGNPKSPSDLRSHQCVTFEGLMSPSSWTFPGERGSERVAVRSRIGVTTADAAIAAALAGTGVTRVLSYQVADALRDGTLVRVLASHEPAPVPVSLVYVGQGRLPMKLRAFIDFAVGPLRERLRLVASPRRTSRGRQGARK
jgi:DNA-binding transcriptional LysR family regulator